MHLFSNTSGAPFVIIRKPSGNLCIVVINFRSESNGISCTLFIFLYSLFLSFPISIASLTIAVSVGSPLIIVLLFSFLILQSVHILASSKINSFSFLDTITPFEFENCTIFILFCVSVPVLSEQITLLLPNVSTAGNFLIIAFFFAIFVTPIESIIVTIAGSPSGIAATARPIDVINISVTGIFFNIPIIKITAQIAKQAIPSTFPTCSNFF